MNEISVVVNQEPGKISWNFADIKKRLVYPEVLLPVVYWWREVRSGTLRLLPRHRPLTALLCQNPFQCICSTYE